MKNVEVIKGENTITFFGKVPEIIEDKSEILYTPLKLRTDNLLKPGLIGFFVNWIENKNVSK